MLDLALVSDLDSLGDFDVHVGGAEDGAARAGAWLAVARVRIGVGIRRVEILFEQRGAVHLDDHVSNTASRTQVVAPAVAAAFLRERLGEGARHVALRRLLDASQAAPPQAPVAAIPIPRSENEVRVFLRDRPFSAPALTEGERALLGLSLPTAARSRLAEATRFATANVARLAGTPIEARVRRIADAAALVLTWSGQTKRAELVAEWARRPVVESPIALAILENTGHAGPENVAPPAVVRARVRPWLLQRWDADRTALSLLRLELAASIAATIEVAFTHERYREELPTADDILDVAVAAASGATTGAVPFDEGRAEAMIVSKLGAFAPPDAVVRAASLARRSVAKLREAAATAPVRDWATAPADREMPAGYFTNGPPRF